MAYEVHTGITATVFWVGEESGPENAFIPNDVSAWDGEWMRHFGGIDDPGLRDGLLPLLFVPLENPFYFALPYNDLDANGERKPDAALIVPWAGDHEWLDTESMVKNRWIRIEANGLVAYAQWEDAGPLGENDVAYVFGSAPPRNTFNNGAGLDVSPAVQDYLGLDGLDIVSWQFVDEADVPSGPWTAIVTTSGIDFEVADHKTPSEGDDWLTGNRQGNRIASGGGADRTFGEAGDDRLLGEEGNDGLFGGSGSDTLLGGAGDDILVGHRGGDLLIGGEGADWLWGRQGRDIFRFRSPADLGPQSASDRIGDFTHGDKIDLSAIDANAARAGNNAFQFIGADSFTGRPGELRFEQVGAPGAPGAVTLVVADLDGDAAADVVIEINGHVTLTRADFLL